MLIADKKMQKKTPETIWVPGAFACSFAVLKPELHVSGTHVVQGLFGTSIIVDRGGVQKKTWQVTLSKYCSLCASRQHRHFISSEVQAPTL
ncbi:hypothetical protein DKY63_03525 [Pseudomonas putida]|uniref:Uncharacterized protein n=1 Tax=Pseudomonas putida TaxID=303 RepID=A0A2Z4RD45_PSEPU|nr:hypothetical protein DKY63_03525 [Pseudomonas putida]